MSVSDKVASLQIAKNNIATAIRAKGVDATGHGFSRFATDIYKIKTYGYLDVTEFNNLSSTSFFDNNGYCSRLLTAASGGGSSSESIKSYLHNANYTFSYALAHMTLSGDNSQYYAEWRNVDAAFPRNVWDLDNLTIHIEGYLWIRSDEGDQTVKYYLDDDIPFTGDNVSSTQVGEMPWVYFSFYDFERDPGRVVYNRLQFAGLEDTFGFNFGDVSITLRYNGMEEDEIVEHGGTIQETAPTAVTGMFFKLTSIRSGVKYAQYNGVGEYTISAGEYTLMITVRSGSTTIECDAATVQEILDNRLTLEFVKKIAS